MHKIILPIVLLAVFGAAFSSGGQGGLNFIIGLPQGEFKESIDRAGFGIGGHIAYQPNPYFAVGGALGLMSYGSETRQERFSLTIQDVWVEVNTSNNFLMFHLLMQFGVPMGYVKPYAEGRLGLNYLWTETSIESQSSEEPFASSTNLDDTAFSYGFGGGLFIKVWEKSRGRKRTESSRTKKSDGQINVFYIDLKATYTIGGEAQYLKEGDIERLDDGTIIYHPSHSTTDLLAVQIGIGVEF